MNNQFNKETEGKL